MWSLDRRGRDHLRHYIRDEVITEGADNGHTVDVAALRAEVWVGEVVEEHKSKQEEDENDWDSCQNEAELLGSVPLADSDVGHKDEGC